MSSLSRREFVRLGAGAAAVPFVLDGTAAKAAALTAQTIVDRIRQHVGVEWNANTVDTFKAGDPSAAVTGIVTTSLATINVLRRATQTGANYRVNGDPRRVTVPAITMAALARSVKARRLVSAASSSVSDTPHLPRMLPTSTSLSAASSRKRMVPSMRRSTSPTPPRSVWRGAGSCSGTTSPRNQGCSKWRSGLRVLCRKCPCS
jgi:hypothetical protein